MKDIYGHDSEYVYMGFETQVACLMKHAITCSKSKSNDIYSLFNVDGLPLFKSSSQQFWPILCIVSYEELVSRPYLVSFICGRSKPAFAALFLNDLVVGLNKVKQDGIKVDGIQYKVIVKGLVCDAPGHAFIKVTKGHIAYYGCEKCTQTGVRVDHRITFPILNAEKRTDSSFSSKKQRQHHKSNVSSPLLELGISAVSQVPLEYMR
ncbi:uncharacterized protein LOC136076287 [Hydra vulgaris]|uniref:Uncharacterized protein LOC136076287 n=1 Tax=Hydra vulgaris TaxID=6087 RepID=A0ABM4BAA9_HYDVU